MKIECKAVCDGYTWGYSVAETYESPGIVLPMQTHTSNVSEAIGINNPYTKNRLPDPRFPNTDALITSGQGMAIGVRTADCVPVLVYAPDIKFIAAIHAGWKGSLARIVEKSVRILISKGASPSLMHAIIGASICSECYEVSQEMCNEFTISGFQDCVTKDRHLDLKKVNLLQLLKTGIRRDNITVSEICTRHSDAGLPSWRRNPGTQERMITWIMLNRQSQIS